MSFLVSAALAEVAKSALGSVVSPFVEEAKDIAVNAAQDAIRGKMAGRMSAEEWADIVVDSVDAVKDRAMVEGNLRYIGGEIKFTQPEGMQNVVTVSFQLFFLDADEKWQKAEASYDIPVARFTMETMEELAAKGEIKYAVE